MKLRNKIITTLVTGMLSTSLQASQGNSSISIETDPATFVFNGYALHVKKSFKSLPRWQFGLGVYSMEFPDILVDMESQNKDKGWSQNLDLGVGVFVDYFYNDNQQGLFTGLQIAYQKYEISKNLQSAQYDTLLFMPYIGYQYDFYKSFYIKPWIGLGYNTRISGKNIVDNETFKVPSLIIFPTVHVGYKF